MNYRLAYAVGVHPWEELAEHPPFAGRRLELVAREEDGREPPYGPALDLGTGSDADHCFRQRHIHAVPLGRDSIRSGAGSGLTEPVSAILLTTVSLPVSTTTMRLAALSPTQR
jgi:hypothetical protein